MIDPSKLSKARYSAYIVSLRIFFLFSAITCEAFYIWQNLSEVFKSTFEKLNSWFFISESALLRISSPEVSKAVEEFCFRAEIMWCNVSGAGYGRKIINPR